MLCPLPSCLEMPWYNRNGWLGIKHQLLTHAYKDILTDRQILILPQIITQICFQ